MSVAMSTTWDGRDTQDSLTWELGVLTTPTRIWAEERHISDSKLPKQRFHWSMNAGIWILARNEIRENGHRKTAFWFQPIQIPSDREAFNAHGIFLPWEEIYKNSIKKLIMSIAVSGATGGWTSPPQVTGSFALMVEKRLLEMFRMIFVRPDGKGGL